MTRLADSPLWGPRLRALLRGKLLALMGTESAGPRRANLSHCDCGSRWVRRERDALVCHNGHRMLLVLGGPCASRRGAR